MLLRTEREELDRRPPGCPVGNLPHNRREYRLRPRSRAGCEARTFFFELRTELLCSAHCLVSMPIARLRAATDQDSAAIRALLDTSSLPTSDLEAARPRFVVACMNEQIVGTGALQSFGQVALLRSIAVEPRLRGTGVGQSIVRELEHIARANGIKQLFFLL